MYSPFYFYFNILSDQTLSKKEEVATFITLLKELPELKASTNITFENQKDAPFLSLTLLDANNQDSWRVNEQITNFNMILAVGEKLSPTDHLAPTRYQYYKDVLTKIAHQLQWLATEEETEEGTEHYVIYSPY